MAKQSSYPNVHIATMNHIDGPEKLWLTFVAFCLARRSVFRRLRERALSIDSFNIFSFVTRSWVDISGSVPRAGRAGGACPLPYKPLSDIQKVGPTGKVLTTYLARPVNFKMQFLPF
jgi:hypothetical protein